MSIILIIIIISIKNPLSSRQLWSLDLSLQTLRVESVGGSLPMVGSAFHWSMFSSALLKKGMNRASLQSPHLREVLLALTSLSVKREHFLIPSTQGCLSVRERL